MINKTKESNLKVQELKEQLEFDPESGLFWWLEPKQGRDLDRPAGTSDLNGYRGININGERYLAHRLAFFYMTGDWPPEYVDHKDGNPRNNSWDNLRLATAQENARNKRRKYNSYTGIKGVVKNFVSDTWDVHMLVDGTVISHGPFYSYRTACNAYDILAKEHFGEFAKREIPRQQRVNFKNKDVQQAIEDFIKDKVLVNGRYVERDIHRKASTEAGVPLQAPRQN